MSRESVRNTLVAAGAVMALAASAGAPSAAGLRATAAPVSDLRVERSDPAAAPPGGTTTVHASVSNGGPDRTASGFTVLVVLPPGVEAEGPFFPASCQVFPAAEPAGGEQVRCDFPAGLPPQRSATALVPLRLGPHVPAPGTLTGGRVQVTGPDDPDPSDNRRPFEIPVSAVS
ncbi:hypothetical protein [Kitasatospora sp. NBC_00315]|uniref:hypothetical protein n=1 Tax=Kitasatospora sp. NBC_00315 TaxID=2975963 RepID=UPI003253C214